MKNLTRILWPVAFIVVAIILASTYSREAKANRAALQEATALMRTQMEQQTAWMQEIYAERDSIYNAHQAWEDSVGVKFNIAMQLFGER
jgi:hypothetical protein